MLLEISHTLLEISDAVVVVIGLIKTKTDLLKTVSSNRESSTPSNEATKGDKKKICQWYDLTPEKSRCKPDKNPGSFALEADALTTRPTRRWSSESSDLQTSTLFSLSASKEQIKLQLKDEIVPQTDTPTFLDPWCEAGHTTYLEATDREDGEKRSAETSPDEKARRNFLGCRLINSDQSLHSNSTTNHGVCIHYVGNGCQNQQEQAGQSPEHGSASHTWSQENHPSA